MKYWFSLLLLGMLWGCHSKPRKAVPGNEPIARQFLQQDLVVLRQTLEDAHPGLYWYASKKELSACFDSVQHLLNHEMTVQEFFKTLLPLISKIRCGHTSISLPPQFGHDFDTMQLLPLKIYCTDKKIFITQCIPGKNYEGYELLRINGQDVTRIVDTLLNDIAADGYNQTFKYHLLSGAFFREGYRFRYGPQPAFMLDMLDKKGQPISATIPALSAATIKEKEYSLVPSSPRLFMDVQFTDTSKTALLIVSSFNVDTASFRRGVTRAFMDIHGRGYQQLIIDIRDNGGGNNNNVGTLFSFLAGSAFLHLRSAEVSTDSFRSLRYVQNANAFRHWTVKREQGMFLVNDQYRGTQWQQPAKEYRFTGKVILLINGGTLSAAGEFAALFKTNQRGIVVGEETGGCYYGATGGSFMNLVLPNSKIRARIPTVKITTAVKKDIVAQPVGRGTIPDLVITPSINDIISGNDIQLKTALGLFR